MSDTNDEVKVDPYGMNPRTVEAVRNGASGRISVVVPLTYLRGRSDRCFHNLKFTLSYGIRPSPYANDVGFATVSFCNRDYETPIDAAEMVTDETVVEAIHNAMRYFTYVRRSLWDESSKDHPVCYEQWIHP